MRRPKRRSTYQPTAAITPAALRLTIGSHHGDGSASPSRNGPSALPTPGVPPSGRSRRAAAPPTPSRCRRRACQTQAHQPPETGETARRAGGAGRLLSRRHVSARRESFRASRAAPRQQRHRCRARDLDPHLGEGRTQHAPQPLGEGLDKRPPSSETPPPSSTVPGSTVAITGASDAPSSSAAAAITSAAHSVALPRASSDLSQRHHAARTLRKGALDTRSAREGLDVVSTAARAHPPAHRGCAQMPPIDPAIPDGRRAGAHPPTRRLLRCPSPRRRRGSGRGRKSRASSPSAAAWTSLTTTTGMPSRATSPAATGVPRQPAR